MSYAALDSVRKRPKVSSLTAFPLLVVVCLRRGGRQVTLQKAQAELARVQEHGSRMDGKILQKEQDLRTRVWNIKGNVTNMNSDISEYEKDARRDINNAAAAAHTAFQNATIAVGLDLYAIKKAGDEAVERAPATHEASSQSWAGGVCAITW